jgi:hypothetical protein
MPPGTERGELLVDRLSRGRQALEPRPCKLACEWLGDCWIRKLEDHFRQKLRTVRIEPDILSSFDCISPCFDVALVNHCVEVPAQHRLSIPLSQPNQLAVAIPWERCELASYLVRGVDACDKRGKQLLTGPVVHDYGPNLFFELTRSPAGSYVSFT